MKTKAVRIYGENDLRLEEFQLPAIKDDEILAHIISDSICMSSHKLAIQGGRHKRIRYDLSKRPCIIGHEFCGELVEVGKKWQGKFRKGQRFAIQPALNVNGTLWAPGYSYEYIGGDATYVVIPGEVMEQQCLLDYQADVYYLGSLSEPVSCIIGAFHAQYHTIGGSYKHDMGIVKGGSLALLASVGPMGMGAIDYAIHNPYRRPGRLVVTDIDQVRLDRAASILTVEDAKKYGVELTYVNTKNITDPVAYLESLNGGKKYDDVFVYAPVKPVVEMADKLLGHDGCLNFFAGPTDPNFSAMFNFYNVHYESHHIVGTSGGNTDDMIEALKLMSEKKINAVMMITHVGGLDVVVDTTLRLDQIPGGKKLIYTNKKLPLVAIADMSEKGKTDPFWAKLGEITTKNNGLWCKEAEDYLLANAPSI
jgi:threonine dehydrogenase-like Zn-dependent dehydrogenase